MQVCANCVMDTSDPNIAFDEKGVCNHCDTARSLLPKVRFSQEQEKESLDRIRARIKGRSHGKKYDCIIGLSGGVDSSYAAYRVHKLGLTALAIHLDNGWDSEIATQNIKTIVGYCGWDLINVEIDWTEFSDLQRSFIKASVVDIEMITDHAIIATMVAMAARYNLRFGISGSNVRTEHCMPRAWLWNKMDLRNIKAIHKQFGEEKLMMFPQLSTWKWLLKRRMGYESVKILNHLNYNKFGAIKTLKSIGWEEYGAKHHESLFTKFYQNYILPEKFKIDKRKAHLSSLIRGGEILRKQAQKVLQEPMYDPNELLVHKDMILEKLGFSGKEWDSMMMKQPVPHDHYASDKRLVSVLMALYFVAKKIGRVKGRRL